MTPDVPAPRSYLARFADALARRWLLIALSALWLFAGVTACLYMWSTHGDPFLAAKLDRTGLITEGPVVDIEKLASPDGHPEWRVTYEFLNIPGQKFRGSIRLPTEAATKPFEKVGNVTVRYLPTDPRVNTIVGRSLTTMTEDQGNAMLLGTAAGLLPLLAAALSAAIAARRG